MRRLAHHAEHFRGRCLVEPALAAARRAGSADPAEHPDRLEHPENAEPGDLTGQFRLLPGHWHVGDRGEVIHLVRLDSFHRVDQAALIEQVTADKLDLGEQFAKLAHPRVLLAAD